MIEKVISFFVIALGKIKWEWLTKAMCGGRYYGLTAEDQQTILDVLEKGNYIILTRRNSHLSTYLENFAHWFLTFRWGHWGHACINVEYAEQNLLENACILEAIGDGVKESRFLDVFDCDAVCILKPIMPENIDWETVVSHGLSQLGKEYDSLFKYNDSGKFSCAELVLFCLSFIPNYEQKFHGLLAQVHIEKNVSPDMFIESGSFNVVLEIRRKLKWQFFQF